MRTVYIQLHATTSDARPLSSGHAYALDDAEAERLIASKHAVAWEGPVTADVPPLPDPAGADAGA